MSLTTTGPKIMYVVSLFSWFMWDQLETHQRSIKRILRYLSGRQNFGIHYFPNDMFELVGYTNLDWNGLVDYRKSTFGYVFSFGSRVFSWSSNK